MRREQTNRKETIRWDKIGPKEKRNKREKRGKPRKKMRKKKSDRGEANEKIEREREIEREKKRGDFPSFPMVGARWSEKKSRSTHRELHVGTKILEFRQAPRGREFSYFDYF